MTAGNDYQRYYRLQTKLENEITKAKESHGLQEMPDKVKVKNEERRLEWIRQNKAEWNQNNSRLAELQRLYDKCFPKKEWVNGEIEAFFRAEEGPLY